MPHDLFQLIEGLRSEDLVSEILAFILREKAYSSVQKLIYNYILDDNSALSTNDRDFNIYTRIRYSKGTPDIVVINKDTVIMIENKFYATYSGGDQLSRYYSILCDEKDFMNLPNKKLVLLTTENRVTYYLNEIIRDFQRNINKDIIDITSLSKFLIKKNILFYILSWQEILRNIESEDLILNSFSKYVIDSYIREVNLMEVEIDVLKSEVFPLALQKLLEGISLLRERVHALGIDTKSIKFSQSIDIYGFWMSYSICNVWFGYDRTLWMFSRPFTPLYLEFRTNWIKGVKFNQDKHMPLLLEFMTYKDEYGFIKPFNVELLNNLDDFAGKLIVFSNNIVAILGK